ncbi:hypothetical protein ACN27F_24520 [Solwaraspora sp. WMMB335]|uniref:hypothetical protein n=1 Tax=Solwaraspora sp. WMMB335 TaxID=3404118 RepID=UPI003B92B1A2
MAAQHKAARAVDLRSEPGGNAPNDARISRKQVENSMDFALDVLDTLQVSVGVRTIDRVQGPLAFLALSVSAGVVGSGAIATGLATGSEFLEIMIWFTVLVTMVLAFGMAYTWHTVDRARENVKNAQPRNRLPSRTRVTSREDRSTIDS